MISDLINGRDMLLHMHEELCDGIKCDNCTMCTEDGGCMVEDWIDKFPSATEPQTDCPWK